MSDVSSNYLWNLAVYIELILSGLVFSERGDDCCAGHAGIEHGRGLLRCSLATQTVSC